MKTPRKKNKKMQFWKIKGAGGNPIDKFPEIDCFIPDAERVADQKAKLEDSDKEWNFWFRSAMDDASFANWVEGFIMKKDCTNCAKYTECDPANIEECVQNNHKNWVENIDRRGEDRRVGERRVNKHKLD